MSLRLKHGVVLAAAALTALAGCSSSGTGGAGANSTSSSSSSSSSTSSSTSSSSSGSTSASGGSSTSGSGSTSSSGNGALSIQAATGMFKDCPKDPVNCNSGKTQQGGTYKYAIEKDIKNWNLNSVDGNTADYQWALDGVFPFATNTSPDLSYVQNKDMLDSITKTSDSPLTIVYKIKQNAVWSDGTPINADDFTYMWKANNGKDCKDCQIASTSGYEDIKSVTGSNGGKTVTVVFDKVFADWMGLFGPMYPAHIAKQHGGMDTPAGLAQSFKWFGDNVPTVSGGPYMISKFDAGQAVTEVPNPKWYGATKPSFDTLVFSIITDATQEPTALGNHDIDGMYPQPEQDLVKQVSAIQGVDYMMGSGLVWEHFDFNLANKALQNVAVRQAMFDAVNRKQIIDKTVGQFDPNVQPVNNHNYMPGQPGYKDVLPAEQGSGNVDKAKSILTSAGYKINGSKLVQPDGSDFPTLNMAYTTGNKLREQECELFKAMVAPLGININIAPTDSLGGTLSKGSYDVIVFAWVGTPSVVAGASQLWYSTSDSNYGHWTNSKSDDLIKQAEQSTDASKAADLLNQADTIMSQDAYVLPLYQKPTFLASYSGYSNIRDNASSVGPPYNVGDWGKSAAS